MNDNANDGSKPTSSPLPSAPPRFGAVTSAGDGSFRAMIADDWAQGRAVFGGLLAAQAARAAASLAPDRALRSALVTFAAPVAPGEVVITPRLLRAGRALTSVEAHISQEGAVCAVVLAAFGAPRPTRLAVEGPPAPAVPRPEGLPRFPYLPGMTPTFTQHFDYRWTSGALPFAGGADPVVQGWLRAAVPAPVDAPALLGLLDAWPDPTLVRSDRVIAASTVTWAVNFTGELPAEGAPGDAWWLYQSRTTAASAGYTDFAASLWSADGRLVAQSRQMGVEFSG